MIEMIGAAALVGWMGVAAYTDLRARRIPNLLTLSGIPVALALQSFGGSAAILSGLLAVLIALGVSFPLFAVGAFGGGDGKLLMLAGAFLGTDRFLTALLVTGVAGGVLSVVEIVRRKAVVRTLFNMHELVAVGASGSRTISAPDSITVPYGVAIAVGAVTACFL